MMRILKFSDPGFAAEFRRIEQRAEEISGDIEETVKAIIADVRRRGDAALFELTAKFDRLELSADTLEVTEGEIDAAMAEVSAESMAALQLAAERIADYHAKQKQETWLSTDEDDV
ncbi:MAG: histidinol dehydrogenase, partial [Chloroflexi bacterium]|nr:histidinol dehydrogenase [Chloroflexota bacterium]